jgi:hypothetical protein
MMRVMVNGSKALVVAVDFGPNQVVRVLQGKILYKPTRTSICISTNKHIEDRFGSVINHSCVPSARVAEESVVTNKTLFPGDEVTIDYRRTEKEMAAPFECLACGGMIMGIGSRCLDQELTYAWKAYL